MNSISIRDYDSDIKSDYSQAFHDLNFAWIDPLLGMAYNDRLTLNDPEGQIIKPGGAVLFAIDNETDAIIGTCALIKQAEGEYELAKMAVDETHRGKGAGQALAKAIITRAKELEAKRLILFTHHKLEAAIALYKKLGFTQIDTSQLSTCGREACTIAMELTLRTDLE